MSYSFPCNWQIGFAANPKGPQRVGYLTAFNGIGLMNPLLADLVVSTPFPNTTQLAYAPASPGWNGKLNVVAILENVSWKGAVGAPFSISCWMSQLNATQLRALQQTSLTTTRISQVGWWVGNYDQQKKLWYEEHYPQSPMAPACQLYSPENCPYLNVSGAGVKVSPNIDINVYHVSFELVPAANQMASFVLASSPSVKTVRPWGLVGGTLASSAVAPAI